MLTTRKANLNDALALSEFVATLDNESEYLLYGPGERKNNPQIVLSYLKKIGENNKSAVFIAENNEHKIVAFICGEAYGMKRMAHTLKVNVGAIKAYQGTGIGRILANNLLEHSRNVGIRRIEVTVIKENKLSLNLCKKLGFEIEGIKKYSININGKFYDEYLLSLILP